MGPLVELIESRGCVMTFKELEEIGLILRAQGLKGVVLCNLCTTKSPGTARELWNLGIPIAALNGGLRGFEDLPQDIKPKIIEAAAAFPYVLINLPGRELPRHKEAVEQFLIGAPQTRIINDFSEIFTYDRIHPVGS